MKEKIQKKHEQLKHLVLHHSHRLRTVSLLSAAGVLFLLLAYQAVYPWNKLTPYTSVAGVSVGGQSIEEATKKLNDSYADMKIQLFFGKNDKPSHELSPADIGMTIDSASEVESAQYSWWMRLIPTSIWWVRYVKDTPEYHHDKDAIAAYVEKQLGSKSCDVKPINANLEYKDEKLQLIPAATGGSCKLEDVQSQLAAARPKLGATRVHIRTIPRPAAVSDQDAAKFSTQLAARTATGMTLVASNETVTVDQQTLLSWLDFKAPDSGIVATVNAKRSAEFFKSHIAPKVSKSAGTSHVTTMNFSVISEQKGQTGLVLNNDATREAIEEWLAGTKDAVGIETSTVSPTVIYTRKYSSTDVGLAALITQFAQEHAGEFGVSLTELGGKGRHAEYQSTKIFHPASTYKLYVAYGTLRRIESGKWHWSDQIQGGRDLTKCFDDMIVLSDNACAKALLNKIGFQAITNEIHAIGLSANTSFMHEMMETTAGDLATFVGALQSGTLLSPSSTNTLLSAMKRNVYRQGIPAGAKGTVADKVGFWGGYLNDAAVVYSPSGTYVLTIMTKGSSWATIAELTRQIEALRTQ